MRIAIALLLLIYTLAPSWAQDANDSPLVKGSWVSPEDNAKPYDWEAQWIWLDEETSSDVMLARRSFKLSDLPDQAELRITATSQYQLYINGKYVCRGPARSAPHHQSFDILDVADLLREGKNILAIRVHHQRGKYSYHHNGRAGLLVQLNVTTNGQVSSFSTNPKWKVTPDPSWSNEAPKISRFQLVVGDQVNLQEALRGWETHNFDDTHWPQATALMRKVGWPSPQRNAQPQALTPPWTSLIPRDVPYLMESIVRADNLMQAIPISSQTTPPRSVKVSGQIDKQLSESLKNYRDKSDPLLLPATASSQAWFLLFDFGEVLNGTPILNIEGAPGTIVHVLSAPFMVDNQFSYHMVDSDFRDQVILSGGRDHWEATYFKPTRYLGILVEGEKEAVRIYDAGVRKMVYPFEEKGQIYSSDAPWVAKYMEASAKTIQVCTTDAYTDNYRERRQYAQTGYYAALGNYWLFGDHALQRRYLVQVAQEQEANGMMPAYAPLASDDYMIIMDSNCLWIRSLWNYFLYSGDAKTTRELLPAARKLINLLHSYTNSLGLLYNPPYPYWLDHALNDRRGANLNLNGHYLGALEDFADLLNWLEEPESEVFQARADLLRQSLRTKLWDQEHQLFADAWVDGNRSDQFSEHANAMALAMNVATQKQAKLVAKQLLADDQHNFIKRGNGMTGVTPAMSYFLHKGLCNYGYVEESFNMFRKRFDQMLVPHTNGTLWEEWWLDGSGRTGKLQGGRTRSDAQTESAFPPALFGEYLLGVKPAKPGLKEVDIFRSPSGVNQITGIIPSPEGNLQVSWNFSQNMEGELELNIPGNMQVKLNVTSLNPSSNQYILVNRRKLKLKKQDPPFIILSRGRHQISF